MKHIFLRLFIISVCMINSSALLALRPAQRGAIATLIKQLDTINPKDIWQKIHDINISPNDYNDPEFKRLNTLAVEKLNSAGFRVNNAPIPVKTILASLPASDKPTGQGTKTSTDDTQLLALEESDSFINSSSNNNNQPTVESDQDTFNQNIQEAFKELSNLKDNVSKLNTKDSNFQDLLYNFYLYFYKIQDIYAGLSRIKATEGKLFFQKNVPDDKKDEWEKISTESLKNILNKAKTRGTKTSNTTIKNTIIENYLQEIIDTNLIARNLSRDNLFKIIDVRNTIFIRSLLTDIKNITQQELEATKLLITQADAIDSDLLGKYTIQRLQSIQNLINTSQTKDLSGQDSTKEKLGMPQDSAKINMNQPNISQNQPNIAPQNQPTTTQSVQDSTLLEIYNRVYKKSVTREDLFKEYAKFYNYQNKEQASFKDETFNKNSLDIVQLLINKLVELNGEKNFKLTSEDAQSILDEIRTLNPIKDILLDAIDTDRLNEIINTTAELALFKKQIIDKNLNVSNRPRIQKAITSVEQNAKYFDTYSKTIANNLERALKNTVRGTSFFDYAWLGTY